MVKLSNTLGQRILHAARLAVAMHLNQVDEAQLKSGQRVAIGRAGPRVNGAGDGVMATDPSTDGKLPDGGDRAGEFARSPFSAEGAAG